VAATSERKAVASAVEGNGIWPRFEGAWIAVLVEGAEHTLEFINRIFCNRLRTIFPADHLAYQESGLHKTIPQGDASIIMMLNTFGAPILNLSQICKRFDKMIEKQIVGQHKLIVSRTAPSAALNSVPEQPRSPGSHIPFNVSISQNRLRH
jgi:hypothetical protein